MLKYIDMRQVIKHGRTSKPNIFYHDEGHGEYYIAAAGITHSDPRFKERFSETHRLVSIPAPEPWLAKDTSEIIASAKEHPFTLVEGDLGAGKSTALFGVRSAMRRDATPYVVINGHFLNQGARIASAIGRAAGNEQVVVYDSFDYNYIRNGRQPKAKHVRGPVTDALQQHIADGGHVIATAHTEPWFKHYSTPQLEEEFTGLLDEIGANRHRVHGLLDERPAMETVCENTHGVEYAAVYPDLAAVSEEPTAQTYRITKLLGSVVEAGALAELDQAVFDTTVRTIDQETRTKMGAPDNYLFLPVGSSQ